MTPEQQAVIIKNIKYEIAHHRENFSTSRAGAGIDADPKWLIVAEDLLSIIEMRDGEIERLKGRVKFLNCLHAAGVDNWVGYEEAQEMMEES